MEKAKKALPFVLLVSFLALSHYKQPQIADSIIIIALVALCGFKYYLDSKEQPDYLEAFKREFAKKDKEIKDLQTTLGIYGISKQNKQRSDEIQW